MEDGGASGKIGRKLGAYDILEICESLKNEEHGWGKKKDWKTTSALATKWSFMNQEYTIRNFFFWESFNFENA